MSSGIYKMDEDDSFWSYLNGKGTNAAASTNNGDSIKEEQPIESNSNAIDSKDELYNILKKIDDLNDLDNLDDSSDDEFVYDEFDESSDVEDQDEMIDIVKDGKDSKQDVIMENEETNNQNISTEIKIWDKVAQPFSTKVENFIESLFKFLGLATTAVSMAVLYQAIKGFNILRTIRVVS